MTTDTPTEIQLEAVVPDVPLSDFSNFLGDNQEQDVEPPSLPLRLPVLAPSTNNEQPSNWSLDVGAIKGFPGRLKRPPPIPIPSAPLRRRFTVIPEYNVPLGDILNDRHASPLSLREFEEYLLYVERSVENLYFCLWLKQYTEEYADWERRQPRNAGSTLDTGSRHATGSVPLAKSFQRAKKLFFHPASQYELNVTQEQLEPLRQWIKPRSRRGSPSKYKSKSKPKSRRKEAWEDDAPEEEAGEGEITEQAVTPPQGPSYPHPSFFDKVNTEIEGTLRQSLTRFFQLAFTNSGRSHDKLGWGVWAVYMTAATVCSAALIVSKQHRAYRLVVAPMLFIAWSVLFSVLGGICPAIFAFGDVRQLRPYEMFLLECQLFMKDPYAAVRVDWRDVSGSGASADPIIRHKRLPRRKCNRVVQLVSRITSSSDAKPRKRKPYLDVEHGSSQPEHGFGFRTEPQPETRRNSGSISGSSNSSPPMTPTPSFPPAAYIPGSAPSVYRMCGRMHKHPWAPTSAALGGFNIYALSPQMHRRLRTAEPEPDELDEDELAENLNLDLSDPRALGLYGPMVTVPNPLVRRVHREIFMRSARMSIAATTPIMILLMLVP